MPDSTLSQAIREAYAAAPAVVIYHTLEFDHPSFSVPLRVVRDYADLTATLEATAHYNAGQPVLFSAYAFEVVPPEVNYSNMPQCVIEIDNVSGDILAQIEAAIATTSLITVIYRQFLGSDLSAPQNNPPLSLTISAISATPLRIRATAGFRDLANLRFPSLEYTLDSFPGLAQ